MAISIVNRNLRFLRKKLLLDQRKFGFLVGISRSMLSHYECGRFEPQNDEVMNVCRFIRVTMDELVGIDFERTNYRYLDFKRNRAIARDNNHR